MPTDTGELPSPDLVSVVIVNYNRCDDLRLALNSVARQDYPRVETIVVDNNSSDASRQMLASEFPSVRTILLNENIGMDGYSAGFAAAAGTYIFQMDNDSEMPDADVLSQVVKRFESSEPNLAAVATRVEEFKPGENDVESLRRRVAEVGPKNWRHFHSGGVGFRKSALDQVGYYNRDVFLYGAELFLEARLLAAGFAIHAWPEILMLHRKSLTARSDSFVFYQCRNLCWYWRLFGTPGQKCVYLPAVIIYYFLAVIPQGKFAAWFRAARQGLGKLPDSLKGAVRSDAPDFRERLKVVGAVYLPWRVIRRASARA